MKSFILAGIVLVFSIPALAQHATKKDAKQTLALSEIASADQPATTQPSSTATKVIPEKPPEGPSSTPPQTVTLETPLASVAPDSTAETPDVAKSREAKTVLNKVYMATFRTNDVLRVVNPERWKVSDTVRVASDREMDALKSYLTELEGLRGQFDQQPQNAYLGFQTYTAITPVIESLKTLSHAAPAQGPGLGADLNEPVQWLTAAQQDLKTYLNYVLQNREHAVQGYQGDLATCEHTLNYAMRNGPATRMPNIMPVLKGVKHPRHTTKAATKRTAAATSKSTKKTSPQGASGH